MPDSPIHDLNSASRITSGDLFVLEQDGQAKKLEGQYFLNWLDEAHRAASILPITTAPTSYTTPTHDFTPRYRIALATVISESRVSAVRVGDQLRYDSYLYPVGYVDTVYAFLGPRVSIRGADGTVTAASITSALGYTPVRPTAIVSSVSSASTNSQAPSAKLFYDTVGSIDAALNLIRGA